MFIPARIEVIAGRPPLILDGGHNNAGIKVLVDYLREEKIRGFTLLFGVLRDKQYPAMARRLAPLAGARGPERARFRAGAAAGKAPAFFRGQEMPHREGLRPGAGGCKKI